LEKGQTTMESFKKNVQMKALNPEMGPDLFSEEKKNPKEHNKAEKFTSATRNKRGPYKKKRTYQSF